MKCPQRGVREKGYIANSGRGVVRLYTVSWSNTGEERRESPLAKAEER